MSKKDQELLDRAYREILEEQASIDDVKEAILRILLRGDETSMVLLKEMANRVEGVVSRAIN